LLRIGCPQSEHYGLRADHREGKTREETRRFGTMTDDLREMAGWLQEKGIRHVAMESTGVYWKPVWNILEPAEFELLLANAHEVKVVPGRKTDQKDSQWIADLYKHGLLRNSFVPPRAIRDLRDLTRTRAILTQEHSSICNRIQKVLEDANIKLGALVSKYQAHADSDNVIEPMASVRR
jgi:transposase